MRRQAGVLAVVLVAALWPSPIVIGGLPGPEVYPVGADRWSTDPAVAIAQDERAALGLPADEAAVRSLIGSGRDASMAQIGMLLSPEEAAAVDIPGREAFTAATRRSVFPYLETLPSFAGVYFDAASNGELVVLLTKPDLVVEREIATRMPAVSRGLRIEYRSMTEKDLSVSLRRTETAWDKLFPGVRFERASVDISAGKIVVEVLASEFATVATSKGQLESALGADIEIRVGRPDTDTDCTARGQCTDPMKGGIRLWRTVIDNHNECTMAYSMYVYDDIQLLTAGHCGYGGAYSWYHKGLPGDHKVGNDKDSLYQSNGQDLMLIGMPDSQSGDRIYGEGSQMVRWASWPTHGATVCDSKGYSNEIDCGTVASADTRYWSSTGGFYVYGGTTNGISQVPGDSGSPLYERDPAPYQDYLTAIGSVTTANGSFGRVWDAMMYFPAELSVPN